MSDRKGFQGMSTFSTEFPVSAKISREQFIQVVVDWVAGIKASNLVGENVSRAAYDNEAELTGPGGERLSLKHVTLPSGFIAERAIRFATMKLESGERKSFLVTVALSQS